MQQRGFGRTDWQVGEIGYGMWGMGGWTGSDDEESRASLERAVHGGCTFFDTAWAYGMGHSERLLGELLQTQGTDAETAMRMLGGRRERSIRSTTCFPPITSVSSPCGAWRIFASQPWI